MSFLSWEAVNFGVSLLLAMGLFTLMLKFFPDARIRWRDVLPGALLTAVALVVGKFAFAYYVGKTALASGYGAAGSVILFLVFVYVAANIVLVGAEFTEVWARLHGQKIEPEPHARRLRRKRRNRRRREVDGEAGDESMEGEPSPAE